MLQSKVLSEGGGNVQALFGGNEVDDPKYKFHITEVLNDVVDETIVLYLKEFRNRYGIIFDINSLPNMSGGSIEK